MAIRSRQGETHYLDYNAAGHLQSVSDDYGKSITFEYDGINISAMVDPAGNRVLCTNNEYDDVVSVQYPDSGSGVAVRTYLYEAEPRFLTGIVNERGEQYTSWKYATDINYGGLATESSGPNGINQFQVSGDTVGGVRVISPLGLHTVHNFSVINGARVLTSKRRVATATTPAAVENRSYDSLGFLTSVTDWNAHTTTYVRDFRGLPLSVTLAAGTTDERLITREWHSNYRLPLSETFPTHRVDYERDAQGNVLVRTVTDLATGEVRLWTYSYDAYGKPLTIDGPRNDVVDSMTLSYFDCITGGQCGQLSQITDALGFITQFTDYNAHGQLTRKVDSNGVVSTYTYDARRRLISQSIAGETTMVTYDSVGNITQITLPDATYTQYSWDVVDRSVGVNDGAGNSINWTLDAAGNRLNEQIEDPTGQVWKSLQTAYDALSRVRTMTPAHGGTTTYAYDTNDNPEQVTDAQGRVTQNQYDALDRVIKEIDALAGETGYVYDDRDNLISVTDAEGKTTTYTYNGFDDLLSVSSPDTGVTSYTVDEGGNRLSQTDARGVTVSYSYDALDRRVSETFPDSALNIQYTYDQGTNGEGRVTSISDASGSTDFDYDARGNLTDVTTTINGQSYSQSYSYNGADRLTDMTYPSGRTVTYTYDNSGRINQVASGNETLADSFTRLPFGPTTGLTLGNGISQSRSYDQDYRVLSITDGSVLSRNYGYNTVDNITAITNSLIPAASQLFTYDDLDRLNSAAGDYGDKSYSYDGIGNRQSLISEQNGTTQTQSYSYAPGSHRLASVTGGPSFQYDAVGNTIGKGSSGFTYNDRNRLSSAVVNGATFTYEHNALGQRVRKSGSTGDTHYVYDIEGRLIMEADGSGTVVAEYSYLDGEPLTMWRGSTTPPAPSVLQNGGFESSLSDWFSCSNSGSTQVVSDPSEGSSALQVTGGDCLYQEFPVTPDTSYVLECDAKGALTQYTSLALTIMDQNFTNLIDEEVEVTSSSYQSFSATLTAPTAGAIGAVTFYSDDTGVFDGCTVVPQNSTPPTPPPVSSMLSNGGFESGLTDWLSCSSSGTTQTVSDPTEGSNALQITDSDCLYQEFAVSPNESYTLQCDAKGALTQYTSVALTIMDQSFTSLIADEMEVTSSAYQSYSTTVAAPGAGAIGAVTFYSEDTGVFDNCTVVEE